jgi:cholest-4-en-3-one 26-monooxygenase
MAAVSVPLVLSGIQPGKGKVSIGTFRFDNPDEYVHGTPHAIFERWRRESPFSWHSSATNPADGFWVATKHADIISIGTNTKAFESSAAILTDPLPRELWSTFPALAMLADNLMTFDPQKHRALRTIANPLFASAARVAALEHEMRATCAEVIDSVGDQFDFATDVAMAIPVQFVLGKLLGVPREDLARLSGCVLALNAMDDTEYLPHRASFYKAAQEIFDYGVALLRSLKAAPPKNLLGELVHSAAGQGLSIEELTSAYWFPFVAGGFDSTASTIAGGVHAFLLFPDQLRRLRADPAAVPSAVDEMLRWVSPVIYFRRTAIADTEFHGNQIRARQKILLCYPSANRDEDIFTDPHVFNVKRTPNPHLTFGSGAHFCIGARIGTMLLRVFLQEFLRRMSGIQMDGDIIRTRSAWMNRIRFMPVRTHYAMAA